MNFPKVSGPLLGVFMLGVLVPFCNKYVSRKYIFDQTTTTNSKFQYNWLLAIMYFQGAIIGILSGHALTFWVSIGGYLLHRKPPMLPFRTDGCSAELLNSTAAAGIQMRNMTTVLEDL